MNSILQRIFPKEDRWQYLAVNLLLPISVVLLGLHPSLGPAWIPAVLMFFFVAFHITAKLLHRKWGWNEE